MIGPLIIHPKVAHDPPVDRDFVVIWQEWALLPNNDTPNTLYYRESANNVVVVSEPLDTDRAHWKPVPPSHLIVARQHGPVEMVPFPQIARVAAE